LPGYYKFILVKSMLSITTICPAGSRKSGNGWFWVVVPVSVLATCAAYVALVLNQATYADVLAQGHIPFFDGDYSFLPVRLSASEFAWVQGTALGAAISLGLLALLSGTTRAGKRELRELRAEAKTVLARAGRSLAQLRPGQRWVAGLSLGLLTGVRCYFSVVRPYQADEVASYDFFIRPGLLAVNSFYPIPNNHLLANTLSWLFYQVSPTIWFTLRLPVLLTSTVGTVSLFVGLLRLSSFRIALVALTLFGWLQPSLYYAGAGRGYWLLIVLAGLHFLAMAALLVRSGAARIAWATLLVTGVLGCYTVPTFAYVVASAAAYLGGVALLRRDWAGYRLVGMMVLGVGGGAVLLYTPALLLSGWRLLLANGYVVARPWLTVVRVLPGFAWLTEGVLFGHDRMGAWGFVGGMSALGLLLCASSRVGRLAVTMRRLGWPALWFVLFPYALLVAQRVLPPARVLRYKSLFFFILLAIVLDAGLRVRSVGRGRAWLAGLSLTLFAAYQTYTMSMLVTANQRYVANSYGAFDWLATHPAGPVLVSVNETALYLLFLTHYRTPHRHWQLATHAQAGVHYRYVIVPHGYEGPYRLAWPRRPAYQNEIEDLYEFAAPGYFIPDSASR
jgi:hypothetical protein